MRQRPLRDGTSMAVHLCNGGKALVLEWVGPGSGSAARGALGKGRGSRCQGSIGVPLACCLVCATGGTHPEVGDNGKQRLAPGQGQRYGTPHAGGYTSRRGLIQPVGSLVKTGGDGINTTVDRVCLLVSGTLGAIHGALPPNNSGQTTEMGSLRAAAVAGRESSTSARCAC